MSQRTNKYLIVSLMMAFVLCKKTETNLTNVNENQQSKKYYYTMAKVLNIREKPSLSSKIIGSIRECEEVLFLENSKINAEVKGTNLPFYKIETQSQIIGYVYSGYLLESFKSNIKPNTKNFEIIGSWPQYYDAPNTIFTFKKDGMVKLETILEIEDRSAILESDIIGTYKYDGCCKIKVLFDSGKELSFDVIIIDDTVTTIRLNCFIFNSDLYKKVED